MGGGVGREISEDRTLALLPIVGPLWARVFSLARLRSAGSFHTKPPCPAKENYGKNSNSKWYKFRVSEHLPPHFVVVALCG